MKERGWRRRGGQASLSEHALSAVDSLQEIQSQRDREIMVGEYNATVTELRDRLVGVAQIPGQMPKVMGREGQALPLIIPCHHHSNVYLYPCTGPCNTITDSQPSLSRQSPKARWSKGRGPSWCSNCQGYGKRSRSCGEGVQERAGYRL